MGKRKNDFKVISCTLTDIDSGEIFFESRKEYNLLFKSERQKLHELLDKFIDGNLSIYTSDYLSIEFQSCLPRFEQKLPF